MNVFDDVDGPFVKKGKMRASDWTVLVARSAGRTFHFAKTAFQDERPARQSAEESADEPNPVRGPPEDSAVGRILRA
jgi:hypothetical protein